MSIDLIKRKLAKLLKLGENTDTTTFALILKSEANSLAIIDKAKDWLKETHGIYIGGGRRRTFSAKGKNLNAYHEGQRDGTNYEVARPEPRNRID